MKQRKELSSWVDVGAIHEMGMTGNKQVGGKSKSSVCEMPVGRLSGEIRGDS